MPVKLPSKPIFFPQVLTIDEKVKYVQTIKSIEHPKLTSVINVVSSQTSQHALYTETVLEVETKESTNKFVKLVKYNKDDKEEIVEVTEVPEEQTGTEETGQPEDEGEVISSELGDMEEGVIAVCDRTLHNTDNNGNTVITTTDSQKIKKDKVVSTSVLQVIKEHPELKEHTVKYAKTTNYGLIEEVVTTFKNKATKKVDIKTVSFYNK